MWGREEKTKYIMVNECIGTSKQQSMDSGVFNTVFNIDTNIYIGYI
jgi:hypothetical protein